MSSATPHRIDPPSAVRPRRVVQNVGLERQYRAPRRRGDVPARSDLAAEQKIGFASVRPCGEIPIQEEWLRLHAVDLIDRIQAWAADLDAREARLNSRTSIQEQRERRFRLRRQDITTTLAEQQRSVERLRLEFEARAGRIAAQNDPG